MEEYLSRYRALSTPVVFDVLDRMGHPNCALNAAIRGLHPSMTVVGPAFTISGESVDDGTDYGAAAFEMYRRIVPGSVLVMAGQGHRIAGPWGENATLSAQLAGARGLVTDTGTRDATAIIERGFPTFVRYVSPVFMSGRFAITGHQRPIALAGQVEPTVTVNPGDFVVADCDGVVIVPQSLIDTVLEAAEELERIEVRIRTALQSGEDRESVYSRLPKYAHIPRPSRQRDG